MSDRIEVHLTNSLVVQSRGRHTIALFKDHMPVLCVSNVDNLLQKYQVTIWLLWTPSPPKKAHMKWYSASGAGLEKPGLLLHNNKFNKIHVKFQEGSE